MGVTPIQGPLRADRRTKDLVKRLKPGDVALIHHAELDGTAAESLLEKRVSAVVNAARSVSSRYANRGPGILVNAGVPLLDEVGDGFFEAALNKEGATALVSGGTIRLQDGLCATGEMLTADSLKERLAESREHLTAELDRFARNTLEYLDREQAILLDPLDVPELRTDMRGRHVLIVVRGEGYKDDLRGIEPYLTDVQPLMIGVDGGADALLDMGLKPHMIVGDMDSVSDTALKCGAELVVHGYADGQRAPGLDRIKKLGITARVFYAPGTSEDIAMILADEKGASLIVAVGTHFSLNEFLDKGRGGMASTFLVRLRIGSKMVDAKGIGRLWEQKRKATRATKEALLIFLAALFPFTIIALESPWLRTVLNTLRLSLRSTFGLR